MELHLPPVFRGPEIFTTKVAELPWHIADFQLEKHWAHTAGGKGILFGVADTGIDPNHPDIRGSIAYKESFINNRWNRNGDPTDRNGHGTHVATTIAAMCPQAEFAIAKVLGDNGAGSDTSVANGIRALADFGCHIINLSLGSPYDSPRIRDAVLHAKSKGSIVVAATGNESASAVGYPARHALGVGAVGRDLKLAWFSNRGKHVDLVGPGVDILAGVPGGGWQEMSGTSMATPWIAAILGLRQSAEKSHLGEIITRSDETLLELETYVTDLGPEGRDTSYGRGLPDLVKGFYSRLDGPGEPPLEDDSLTVSVQENGHGRTWDGVLSPSA